MTLQKSSTKSTLSKA